MDYLILQVDEKRLTAARFALSGQAGTLIGAASFELSGEHSLADAAGQIAGNSGGSPRVVLCLPAALFAQRMVSLPFNDLRKAREVVPAQLQGEITLPVEELVLDLLPAGEGNFLALWAKKSEISRAIQLFSEAGIEPHLVSSLAFAVPFIPGVPADCALFDGGEMTVLTAGKVTYFRALDAAGAPAMIAATLSALEMTGRPLPPKLCLIGGEEAVPIGDDTLPVPVERLETPPEMGRLFKNDETFRQLAGLYAVAKACQSGTLPDFRKGELAWTSGDVNVRKKLLLTGVLTVLVVALLFAGQGLKYRAANADLISVNNSISALYREIFPGRAKAVDELSEVKGEIRKLAGAENSSGYLDVLKKLAEVKGTSINGLYEVELEGTNLRMKGDARSSQAAGEFKSSLASMITGAELGEIKSRPDGTVTFSLTGTLKEAGK